MAESDFERYKAALKAGHVALLRERLTEALGHYEEAARIAPERTLPHASQGRVLLRLGRNEEALGAFARALGRDPGDEAALAGRAEALGVAGRDREAGEVLERLAEVEVASGRLPEGLTTLRRATELQATKRRRRRLDELERQLAATGGEPASATAPAVPPPAAAGETSAPAPSEASPEPVPEPDSAPPPAAAPAAAQDPLELEGRASLEVARGQTGPAVAAYLAAARARSVRGEPDAALEACHLALALAPADAAIHLALVRQYIDRGWRELAARKLDLLRTLDGLDSEALDDAARSSLAALGQEVGAGLAPPPRDDPPPAG